MIKNTSDLILVFVRIMTKILVLFCITSCGFHPIYQKYSAHHIPAINIRPIDSTQGAELYRHLSDIIDNDPNSKYLLQIELNYSSSPLIISKDSDVIEQSTALTIHFDLLDVATQRTIKSENFRLVGSYNKIFSAYISYVEEDAQKINLAKQAAEGIQQRLAMYFNTHTQ